MNKVVPVLFLLLGCTALHAQMGKPGAEGSGVDRRLADAGSREPGVTPGETTLLEKVDTLLQTNLEQAQGMLESIVSGEASVSAIFNYALGNVYMRNRRYQDAGQQFQKAIRKFPDFRRAWKDLGTIEYLTNNLDRAIVALSKCIELGDSDPNTFGILGYCHLKTGNHMASRIAYDMAVLLDPENLNWLEGKAQISVESRRYEEALHTLGELIRRDPKNSGYWLLQANVHLAMQNPLKAARNVEIVRMLGKADAEAHFLLGNIYLRQGFFGRAADIYIVGLEMSEAEDFRVALKVAQQLLNRGRNNEARKVFSNLAESRKDWTTEDYVLFGNLRAEFAIEDGEDRMAINILNKVLERDPLNGRILTKLADLYARNGERGRAHYTLEKVKVGSEYEYLALVYRSRMLIEDERYGDSLEFLQKALDIRPSAPLRAFYDRVRVVADQVEGSI